MKRIGIYNRIETSGGNNKGTTMVEVLVAFTVLTLIMGILYGLIAFTSVLRMRAHDADMASQSFVREMYNKANAPEHVEVSAEEGKTVYSQPKDYSNITVTNYETGDSDSTPLFYMSVNTKDTYSMNFGASGSKGEVFYNELSAETDSKIKEGYWLSLFNIEAITYVYRPDEGMDSEHIIIPKAVKFVHKKDREE